MQASIWLPVILASLGPVIIPPAHMAVLWFYWQNYARFVDRRFCSCSCWDTVFKGKFLFSSKSIFIIYPNTAQVTRDSQIEGKMKDK